MNKTSYKPLKEKAGSEEVLDLIFRDASVKHGLKEFQGTNIPKEIKIFEKEKDKFYIRCLKRLRDILVHSPNKNAPEEVIRQLWLKKLTRDYGYPLDRIEVEKSIQFGREIRKKAADIVVYKKDKITPYIIFELKNPNERRAIEQLKGYLNAEGCEIGIWSNGIDKVILYRPYPKEFSDTLPDMPKASQTIDDLFREKKTLADIVKKGGRNFSLKRVIQGMEELVLANAGVDVFNKVFK